MSAGVWKRKGQQKRSVRLNFPPPCSAATTSQCRSLQHPHPTWHQGKIITPALYSPTPPRIPNRASPEVTSLVPEVCIHKDYRSIRASSRAHCSLIAVICMASSRVLKSANHLETDPIRRNPYSTLNHRPFPAQSSLFSDYPGGDSTQSSQNQRSRPQSSQGYGAYTDSPYTNGRLSPPIPNGGFRPATPNSRGQYATSVLESLESQNDTTATTLLSQKVGQLKQLTIAIGDEIRDSSSLAQTINDQFEGTGVRLRGTMRRMLRMAERTGVGWKVWVGFFICIWLLFAWVWLF